MAAPYMPFLSTNFLKTIFSSYELAVQSVTDGFLISFDRYFRHRKLGFLLGDISIIKIHGR